MSEALHMWTVYERPSDFPHCYVARRWEIFSGGRQVCTADVIVGPTLERLREVLRLHGLSGPLMRDPEDDPVIVETWI